MCGRATLTSPGDELREQLGLDVVPTVVPRFNIAPSQPIAVIKTPRILSFAAFGLSSFTGKPGRTINLRAESLPNIPAYRDAFKHHRCLVVVDGFFEWRIVGEEEPRQKGLTPRGAHGRAGRRRASRRNKPSSFAGPTAHRSRSLASGLLCPTPPRQTTRPNARSSRGLPQV